MAFPTAVILLLAFLASALAIWPEPVTFQAGSSVLWLAHDFHISLNGQNASSPGYSHGRSERHVPALSSIHRHPSRFLVSQHRRQRMNGVNGSSSGQVYEYEILEQAIQTTTRAIQTTSFVPWKFHSRKANWEPSLDSQQAFLTEVVIHQQSPIGQTNATAFFAGDESYTMDVGTNGSAAIRSNSTMGTIRALQTLEQLFYAHSSGSAVYTPYAPLSIQDRPTWRHRGVNLDISRNPFQPSDALRTIDAMATVKLSRLHLHATDAQSWPIEIPSLPDLARLGAYQPQLVWSAAQLAEVQQYGLSKGIAVFLEIDMPGHSAAIANAYPDLIAAFNESDWSTFAAEPPTGQLKLNSSAVYEFLDTLFADLLPRVSPYTINFHNGGDEVQANAYLLDETVQSNSSVVLQPMVQKMMNHVSELSSNAGLTPIMWEEMLLEWNLTLPSAVAIKNGSSNATSDVIIQVWISSDNLNTVLEKGYRALFGDYNHWYLDCGHGTFLNPYPSGFSPSGIPYNTSGGVPTQILDPFTDYCSPFKNWRHIYVYNPLENITANLQHLIEGGEVHLWTEQIDPVDMDRKLWPRAAAAAEVLWTGPRTPGMIEGASSRLGEWRERLVLDHGVGVEVVQETWCLMEGGCNL